MCACNQEVPIEYRSKLAPEPYMIPPQLTDNRFHCREAQYNRAVSGQTALPQGTEDCSLNDSHI